MEPEAEEAGHAAYFQMPTMSWDAVDTEVVGEIAAVGAYLDRIASALRVGDTAALPTPGDVALRLTSLGSRVLASLAADEADLRQVITTLRTALTVCWDMYGVTESEQVTVREHMNRLKRGIEGFEADLTELRSSLSSKHDGR